MKKSPIFDSKDFASLIMEHNPFGVKGSDGAPIFFNDYSDVYFYVLDVLHKQFKRGYVDIILLVNVLTQAGVGDCEYLFRQMKSLWGLSAERLINYHFDSTDENDHQEVVQIMKALHVISGTHFDPIRFNEAFIRFQTELAKEGGLK